MRVLVTGSAGFIGNAIALKLLERGDEVVGLDIVNDYYDPAYKEARLDQIRHHPNFREARIPLESKDAVGSLFAEFRPEEVIHFAAQVGVRNGYVDPHAYLDSNITGFVNILEGCRRHNIKHLVFASSSSVYGANTQLPYSVHDKTDTPINLYAATKKADELLGYAYSHSFSLPITGLRFFTVYGPWGRPDMAISKFTKSIIEGNPIEVFNRGQNMRDFTYIDDIIAGILRVLERPPASGSSGIGAEAPFRLYNLGNGTPVKILRVIEILESELGTKADKILLPPAQGDMETTVADVTGLESEFGFRPSTSIEVGIQRFVKWYQSRTDNP